MLLDSKIISFLVIGLVIGSGLGFGINYSLLNPKINEYEERIKSLNTKVDDLSQQILTINILHEQLNTTYNTLNQQNTQLKSDYNSLYQKYNTLNQQNTQLKTDYDSLLTKYQALLGAVPLTPEPISTKTIDRQYSWSYKGSTWSLSLSIPDSMHTYYKSLERPPTSDYSVYVTHPYDDEYLKTIITKINFIALDKGFTEADKVNLVVAFIQSLPYTSDSVTTGFDNYARYPLETLVDNGGDCEDTAILAAAFLNSMGYDVVLLGLPKHMATGVSISNVYGSYYNYNDKKYFYLETTGEGWSIGQIPDDYKGVDAQIYELKPVPILTHTWTAKQEGSTLSLSITVKNMGSATATGYKIAAAFDAGDNQIWNKKTSDPFTLAFDRELTITLTLQVPVNKYTRLIVYILHPDGYYIDISYSNWYNT